MVPRYMLYGALSVRMYVRLFVTIRYCTKLAKHDRANSAAQQRRDSETLTPKILMSPNADVKYRWG